MSIKDKISNKKEPVLPANLKNTIDEFKQIVEAQFENTEITPFYNQIQKTHLILLGNKYYTGDQMTLIDFKIDGQHICFNVFSNNYDIKSTIDENNLDELETFFADIFDSDEIQAQFHMYNVLSDDTPPTLRIFEKELYFYSPNDITFKITLEQVLSLKSGSLTINTNQTINNDFLGKKGEVNGFVFHVKQITAQAITLIKD